MNILSAADYAARSGWPLKTIKIFCKNGIIPHERRGRKYYIPMEMADQALKIRLENSVKLDKVQDIKTPPKIGGGTFEEIMRRRRMA